MRAPAPARVGYATPLANSEFRGLTLAQVISECGDQVARIALAVLVFNQLHSAFYTALTYAVGYLPLVVGGTLLTGGYGSALGSAFGAFILGTTQLGINFVGINSDWYQVVMGAILLLAVLANTYLLRRASGARS